MLISMNWINEFVDLSNLDKEALIKRFTLSTAEVEEIIYKGEDLINVVVGKILSVENHPSSKKLHLLKVDGGDKVYDVVCGAPNVAQGILVPFVKEGGRVGTMDIATATIAGFESHGMCCSEAELGISADHSGLMLLPQDLIVGTDIRDIYNIRDIVFEVDNKSITNRPDLWGHYGIAREFSALTGRPLKPLEVLNLDEFSTLAHLEIKVLDNLCQRYSGMTVANVTKKITPVNMRIRLYYCGLRAINLLADLTNYLMLEVGQPMHAFDEKRVSQIEVKRFDTPFVFKTLDGENRACDENTLMICSKGEPVAIAGIMGGLESEIEDDTTSLLLESACFDPVNVRKTSTRLSLRTDASMRYEKTLDPEMTTVAIARFLKLLKEIDPQIKITSSLTDVIKYIYPTINLSFGKSYVDRYTGIDIGEKEILTTLNALGFNAKLANNSFEITVPSWRATKDVTIKADIIEEITRIYGYDNFAVKTTKSPLFPVLPAAGNNADYFAKDILVGDFALHEVHSYLWNDAKKLKDLGIEPQGTVKLLNSINPDFTVIRSTIVPTLLSFVNENRSYSQEFGIFEIGRTVAELYENGKCKESKKLGISLFSRAQGEKELFFNLRNIVQTLFAKIKHISPSFESCESQYPWQHPVNTIKIMVNGVKIGFMNTIYPTVKNKIDKKAAIVTAELDMDLLAAINASPIAYSEPSKFPGIDIDLSLTMPLGVTYSHIEAAWQNLTDLLKQVSLIDVYEGEQKSLTLRFSFISAEKTLSKAEIQVIVDKILENLNPLGVFLKS